MKNIIEKHAVYTGKKFKETYEGKQMIKVLPKNLTTLGFEYKIGNNTDSKKLETRPVFYAEGLHFCFPNDITGLFGFGDTLVLCTVDDDATVVELKRKNISGTEYRTDKLRVRKTLDLYSNESLNFFYHYNVAMFCFAKNAVINKRYDALSYILSEKMLSKNDIYNLFNICLGYGSVVGVKMLLNDGFKPDYYTFITALENKNVDCIKLVANNYEDSNSGISSYVKETVVRTDEIEVIKYFSEKFKVRFDINHLIYALRYDKLKSARAIIDLNGYTIDTMYIIPKDVRYMFKMLFPNENLV